MYHLVLISNKFLFYYYYYYRCCCCCSCLYEHEQIRGCEQTSCILDEHRIHFKYKWKLCIESMYVVCTLIRFHDNMQHNFYIFNKSHFNRCLSNFRPHFLSHDIDCCHLPRKAAIAILYVSNFSMFN